MSLDCVYWDVCLPSRRGWRESAEAVAHGIGALVCEAARFFFVVLIVFDLFKIFEVKCFGWYSFFYECGISFLCCFFSFYRIFFFNGV